MRCARTGWSACRTTNCRLQRSRPAARVTPMDVARSLVARGLARCGPSRKLDTRCCGCGYRGGAPRTKVRHVRWIRHRWRRRCAERRAHGARGWCHGAAARSRPARLALGQLRAHPQPALHARCTPGRARRCLSRRRVLAGSAPGRRLPHRRGPGVVGGPGLRHLPSVSARTCRSSCRRWLPTTPRVAPVVSHPRSTIAAPRA